MYRVLKSFEDLIDLEHHTTRKSDVSNGKLLGAHAFDYIVLRGNTGLTSC